MEIARIWGSVRSRWPWVVLCVLAAVSVTAAITIVSGTKYAAKSELLVSASGGGFGTTSEAIYNAERLSATRAPTYAQLIQNREILTRAAVRTRQGVSPDDIQRALDVRTTRDIPIIRIAVVDEDPRRAADIVTNLGSVFSDYVAELESSDGVDVTVSPVSSSPEVMVDGSVASKLLLAGLSGLLFGLIAVGFAERLDSRIRTGRELEEIGASFLGSVRVDPTQTDSWQAQDSAEDYRRLAAGLSVSARRSGGTRLLVVGVGSSIAASTVAHGLAAYLAEAGEKTLLIDARGDLAGEQGYEASPGLTDLMQLDGAPRSFARYGKIHNLAELSVGMEPARLQSLLIGHDFAPLAAELDATFDFVIIDAPAATESPTGVAIAPLADSAVIIGEIGRSNRSDVDDLASVLSGLHVAVVGVVLAAVTSTVAAIDAVPASI